MAITVERVTTPRGELVLRRCVDSAEHFEVISNGVFLMDTRNGESERLLVRAALALAASPRNVLVGGLGVGFSLLEALADERVERVVVVEIEPAILRWHEQHLRHISAEARSDRRTEIVIADVATMLRDSDEQYDVICLDVDNGPSWTVTEANAGLYGNDGTALIASRLTPGGVLSVWSAARSASYEQVLSQHFGQVNVIDVPVPRGEPDVVFTATRPVAQTQGRDSDSS
ncbi:MAG TPA: hypothetical protein VG650_13765 [Mycobacteriales bacterium]|nr:hypothetical protein [Mycobacteriales bacterium]